jgi:hypothetical protein
MGDQVERFEWLGISEGLDPIPEAGTVLVLESDHRSVVERLEAERDTIASGKLPPDHSLVRAEQAEGREERYREALQRIREEVSEVAHEVADPLDACVEIERIVLVALEGKER